MSNRIERMTSILVSPYQVLLDVIDVLMNQRSINPKRAVTASGKTLEIIGAIVGQRKGAITDDAIYMRYIRARVAVNRSSGVSEDLIRIAQLVIGNPSARVVVTSPGVATTRVDVTSSAIDQPTADALLGLLQEAASGGVRVILDYALSAPSGLFRYDSGPGYDAGHYAGSGDNT